jgi:hypothetical protein
MPINITMESYMQIWQKMLKINNYLQKLYVDIVMDVKKTNNYLQDLYVNIAYLKWPCGNYNRKDVGITQCSFWFL